MKLTASNVHGLFAYAQIAAEEETGDYLIIRAKGIRTSTGFSPRRLREIELSLEDLLKQLPDGFHDGAYSPADHACWDRDGEQWACGTYPERMVALDKLIVLAEALGYIRWMTPRDSWSNLPHVAPFFTVVDPAKVENHAPA